MTAAAPLPHHVVPIAWPSREVPLAVYSSQEPDAFIHLTSEANPMARYVIGFAACPARAHRSDDGRAVLLTLWLSPTTARCSACDYIESLAAFMARMGWEQVR